MSCGGSHLGFPIHIKNRNLEKDIPMIIHLQFGFSQFISFREEDLWNSANQRILLALAAMLNIRLERKNRNFVEDHPRNIPAKFGSNWSGQWFRRRSLKCEKFTDDRWRVPSGGNSSHRPLVLTPGELKSFYGWLASTVHVPSLRTMYFLNGTALNCIYIKFEKQNNIWGITSCVLSFNVAKMFKCIDINHSIMLKSENRDTCFI
jgi:hypothetical protein